MINKDELLSELIDRYKQIPLAGTVKEKTKDISSLLEKELEPLCVPGNVIKKELQILKSSLLHEDISIFYNLVPKGYEEKYGSILKHHGTPISYLRIRSKELIIDAANDSVFIILSLAADCLIKRYINEVLPLDIYIDPLHSEEYLSYIFASDVLAIKVIPVKYSQDEYAILCMLLVEKKERGKSKYSIPVIATPIHA